MADEGPSIWAERAAARERKLHEQLAAQDRRDLLEKEREERDADILTAAIDVVMTVEEQRRALQQRLDELDHISLEALRDAERRLDEIRENANRAKDGRRVYEAGDGTIYDEDGSIVERDEIEWSTWRQDGPSREQYEETLRQRDQAVKNRERLREQRERLEQDPDEEDLREIEDELDELEAGMAETFGSGYKLADSSSERSAARTTSLAKTLDPDQDESLTLRRPFYAAATADPSDIPQEHPDIPFRPGAFTPV